MKRSFTQQSTQVVEPASRKLSQRKGGKKKSKTFFGVPRGTGVSTGFPKQLRVKHRYVESYSPISGSGTANSYQFSCNGMYDPNITGTGHQPMYFDQLAALYNHYTVLRSKITVQFMPTAAIFSVGGVYIEDDTSITPATLQLTMCEQNSASFRVWGPSATVTGPTIVSKSWDAVSAFGPNPLANDNLQGTVAANPSEQQYFTVFFGDLNGVSVDSQQILVTIEYEAVWDELKNILGS